MQFKIPHKRNLLCAAVSLSLLPVAGTSLAQDEATVEEVIVTGSYIRRSEGFTQASTVVQLTAEDLEAEGTMNIGEVVQNLSFVNGDASAITNTIQGQDSRSTTIDLRGLGGRSTLTLLDGRRIVNENVNALIPTIAIQRLDIVADGSAALYGNEAVAGVVNFVPYTSYDGFRIESYAEGDTRGDYDEHSMQMMWGGDIGDLDVVLAGQFRQNSRLGWDERNVLANSGLTVSSNAPGNWFVPVRGEDGEYTGSSPRATYDPNCRPASEREDYTPDQPANVYGMQLGSNCFFDFGDNRSYREPTETTQLFANATWDFSDDLTISAQGYMTRLAERTYSSTSNPGNSRIGELPAVRGEHPGNPFRAVNAMGQPLYAVDHNRDGLPDRLGIPANLNGQTHNQMGECILPREVDRNGDCLTDPILTGNGGLDPWIPLYEDVVARRLRPINKTHTRSDGHSPDADNLSDNVDHLSRWTIEADFNVPFLEGWEGNAALSRAYRELIFMSNQNYDISAMIQGLNCDVINDRDKCYSPFLIVNPEDNNSVHVMNAVAGRSNEVVEDKLNFFDLVLNGELNLGGFELPGGPIGAAVGYQYRDDHYMNVPSEEEIAGVTWIGSSNREAISRGSREIDAYFAEFALPVLDNLQLELAVRHESFSTGQTSTDPKYGITYAPTDWLSLRATAGDAFIAPTLEQLLNPITCGLGTVSDPFSSFEAWTTTCGGGNSALGNETSQSRQLGFDLTFDNFDLHVTWNETDFQNRIVAFNAQDILDREFEIFKEATGFSGSGKPSLDQLQDWVNDPRSNKEIIRARGSADTILQICCRGSINAEFVKVTAYDIQGTYTFGFDAIGDFRLNLQATHIAEFLVQGNPEAPVRDVAGLYNYGTGAAPELPSWKANLRMSWNRGNHSVVSTVHYIDDLPYDGPTYSHMDFFGGFYRPGGIVDHGIYAWTDMDIAYTYRGFEMFDGEMSMTIGSRNVFDREAQRSPEFAGVVGGLQDPLGRLLYARLVYDF